MSRAPLTLALLAATTSAIVGASSSAASPVSAILASLAPAASTSTLLPSISDSCHLRLVLVAEGGESFVQTLTGALTHCCHLDLFR